MFPSQQLCCADGAYSYGGEKSVNLVQVGTLKCSQHWCYRRETQVWGVSVMVRKCDDRSLSCLGEGEGTLFGPQKDFTGWPELVLSETKNRTVVR